MHSVMQKMTGSTASENGAAFLDLLMLIGFVFCFCQIVAFSALTQSVGQ